MAAREEEQTEGAEETDSTEMATEKQLSAENIVVTITLGTHPNVPLSYAPVLELNHPIMSTLGAHVGQLQREIERQVSFEVEWLGKIHSYQ